MGRAGVAIWFSVVATGSMLATSACSGDDSEGGEDGGVEPDAPTVCTPEADSACLGAAVADVDSCGTPGALTEVCPCGCTPDERACSAFTEPSIGPADDPACEVRTECVTIERVVCEQRVDGMWHSETRYANGCGEAVRCAGYGTEAYWDILGLVSTCFSLNGTSWGPDQTGLLVGHPYGTLEDCQLASNIGGPSNHACVTLASPASCLQTDDACEQLCP